MQVDICFHRVAFVLSYVELKKDLGALVGFSRVFKIDLPLQPWTQRGLLMGYVK